MHKIVNYFRAKSQCNGGFSLIEVMVAIAIFLIGILGAYQLQLHATNGNTLANRVMVSKNWASYAVEELLAKDYFDDDLEDGAAKDNGLNTTNNTADGILYIRSNGLKSDAPSADDIYTIYWNVETGTPGSTILNNVKHIRVHVRRNGGIGNGILYSHDYYKARWPELPAS